MRVCVCAYVRTYVLVTLRNVNLQSRSECQFALTLRNSSVTDMCITQGSQRRMELGGQHFLAMEDEQDSTAGPLQCTYLAKSSAETSAEHRDQEENKKEF